MQEAQQATTRFAIGIIGNVISFILFLAPMPTFWRIWKKKSTEEFHPYPYLATLMNCIFWVWYALPIVHPDSTLVVTINAFGLILEIFYLSFFFFYTNRKNRVIISSVVAVEIALFMGIGAITVLCFETHYNRSMFVGIICVVFGTIMYAAPLSIIWRVIETKSSEYLPIWLCLVGLLNGICWFGYAFLKKLDPYLLIPNGLGAVLGLIQLVKKLPVEELKLEMQGVIDEIQPRDTNWEMFVKARDYIEGIWYAVITERNEFCEKSPEGKEHNLNGVNQTLDSLILQFISFEDEWKKVYANFFTPRNRAGPKRQRTLNIIESKV